MSNTLPQPAEQEWKGVQVEVIAGLWPRVKSVAAAKDIEVREYVSEVLQRAVVEDLKQIARGMKP